MRTRGHQRPNRGEGPCVLLFIKTFDEDFLKKLFIKTMEHSRPRLCLIVWHRHRGPRRAFRAVGWKHSCRCLFRTTPASGSMKTCCEDFLQKLFIKTMEHSRPRLCLKCSWT